MKYLTLALFVFLNIYAYSQPTAVKLIRPNGGEVFRAGTSEDIVWDTTLSDTYRARWAFQFGTSPSGPWTDLPGASNVLDSGRTRGRYAGGFRVPALPTKSGYLRIVLLNPDGSKNEAVSDVTDGPFTIDRPEAAKADSILRTPITSRVQLSNKKIYGLDGYVFVDDGGVLAIEPGTIIIGDTVGENSAICINRGGKIYAKGTKEKPIVMTSSAPPGQRRGGDWGGLLICGKAATNHPGGEAALEGGIADANRVRGWFGGKDNPDDNDSSGVVEFVRIEFAGIAAAPNQELNSLTMGGVGRRTVIRNVMVSYGNDDGFEWFGGTVDGKYLIAIGTLDDDFDGDNGWSGRVQFGLVQRFPQRADVSTSQAFEMDNDASGTYNTPLTRAVFSNITAIGPVQDTSWSAPANFSRNYGAAIQIRRNNRTSIFNSVIVGWPRGIEILGSGSQGAATRDSIRLKHLDFHGIKGVNFRADGTGFDENWIYTPAFNNVFNRRSPQSAALTNPFGLGLDFNPLPLPNAPYLDNASFDDEFLKDPFFEKVNYRGAFSPVVAERWDLPWAEYDPQNKNYALSVENDDLTQQFDIRVYPLPADEYTSVIYSLKNAGIVSIKLYDAMGKLVQTIIEGEYQHNSYYQFNIDTRHLTPGMYLLNINSSNGDNITSQIPVVR